ncbi:MAG: HEAT repeat domain-containing protein, partial [Ktedonobacterales bacterium]
PEAVRALMDEYARGRLPSGIVASSLLGMGPAGGPALQALLHADEAPVRALAATLIGLLDWTPAGDDLLALLRDDAASVRSRAAESLGRLGTQTATAPLLALLRDAEREARVASAEALGQLGDPAALEGLAAALADEQHDVRLAAAAALGTLGATGPRALGRVTRGGDPQARAYAVEVLQRAGRDDLIGAVNTEDTPELLPAVAVARTDTRVPTLARQIAIAARDLTPQPPLPQGEAESSRQPSATDSAVKPARRKRPKRAPTDGAVRPRPKAPIEPDLPLPPAVAPEIGLLTLPDSAMPERAPHLTPLM